MPHHSKICQKAHSKKARLIHKQRVTFVQNELKEVANLHKQLTNEERLRFLINERSITLSQEVEKLETSKKKLEEHAEKLQRIVEDLERENYYLEKKSRVLRGLVEDYQDQSRALEDCILMVFILGKLVVGLYLLGFFDGNDSCVTVF